jgi:hypothetical protein
MQQAALVMLFAWALGFPCHNIEASHRSIVFTRLVQDFEPCDSARGHLAMCVSKDFVCRMKEGEEFYAKAPSCLPYKEENDDFSEKSAFPWKKCDPEIDESMDGYASCRYGFECACIHNITSRKCKCIPPDSVHLNPYQLACQKNKKKCVQNEYCKWLQNGTQACALRPYSQ